ncbi:MAG TPA: FHA domain-containing protein [Planctomycetota bacterium]
MKFCPVDRCVNADDAPRCRNCGHVFGKARKEMPASTLSRVPGPKPAPAKTRSRAGGDVEVRRLGSPGSARAVLQLIDAEGRTVETFRLQAEPVVLGRSEGLVTFPDDDLLSPAHLSLRCDGVQAFVRDLKSLHGTFLRAEKVELFDGLELLLGGTLLRFTPAGSGWQIAQRAPDGTTRTAKLEGAFSIGRRGQDLDLDDPAVSSPHAKVRGGALTDVRSLNGTYYRIPAQRNEVLDAGGMFRAGRQLFRFAPRGR